MSPSIHELDGIWVHADADEHGAKQEPLIALEAWTQRVRPMHLETRLKGNPSQDLPEAMADECFQNGAFVEDAFGTVKQRHRHAGGSTGRRGADRHHHTLGGKLIEIHHGSS